MPAFTYCPDCGGLLETKEAGGRPREWCPRCQKVWYHNPVAAAAAVIVEGDSILLCRRTGSVFGGRWYIPAGFCEEDETIEACCLREAKEETGLDVEIESLVDANSGFEVAGRPVLGVYFRVRVTGGALRAGDDVDDARYFPLGAVPDLPFAGDRRVVEILRSGRYPYSLLATRPDSG